MLGKEIDIVRYNPEFKKVWNDFVESSKNGTFLFNRDYLEYHSDRFEDFSLLFYKKGSLYCLMPANIKGDTFFSHGGLTYGGLVMSERCTAEGILKIFTETLLFLKEKGINRIIYKPVPHIYHSLPAEEDLYSLFRNNAKLIGRNISCTIFQTNRIKYSNLRRRTLRKALSAGIVVSESNDFNEFWKVLEDNLFEKYGANPVHSLEEILKLASLFPQIKLFVARKENEIIGGVVFYFTAMVIHAQYISATRVGKSLGAVDAIINYVIEHSTSTPYFDLGTSNADSGKWLNETLIHHKEGFGGRAICYDTYQIEI